jgi:hypothetical protein
MLIERLSRLILKSFFCMEFHTGELIQSLNKEVPWIAAIEKCMKFLYLGCSLAGN